MTRIPRHTAGKAAAAAATGGDEHPTPDGLACPSCHAPLRLAGAGEVVCPVCRVTYSRIDGVWRFLTPDRASRFERFVDEYNHVRRAEGRGSSEAAYYRALPFRSEGGRLGFDWRIRAATYRCFVERILEPLETELGGIAEEPNIHYSNARGPGLRTPPSPGRQRGSELPQTERLRILDLGAGNGWMSHRMAVRGHDVYAVDLRTDDRDGLGAHRHYDASFDVVQAEFNRLPFRGDFFDLIVYNASFHYSDRYEVTLLEALRVLKPIGRVIIADSPLYSSEGSGERMVGERRARFQRTYGFASDSIDSEEYVTPRRLRQLAARLGVTWIRHRPRYGLRWGARRLIGRLRNGRESAQFGLVVGQTKLDLESRLQEVAPHPTGRRLGVTGLHLHRWMTRAARVRRTRPDSPASPGPPPGTPSPSPSMASSDWTPARSPEFGGSPATPSLRSAGPPRAAAPGTAVTESIRGMTLQIPQGVFNPVLFRSGALLAETVFQRVLPPQATVLDMGTGSGVCGIAAAGTGASVVAVDINPIAVSCARANAVRNGVDMDVRHGNLFEGLGSFDVVLFNPPYFRARPVTAFEWAWQSMNVVERFSTELRSHLRRDGFALVVLSTDGRCANYLRRFADDGYRISVVHDHRYLNETLSIYRIA